MNHAAPLPTNTLHPASVPVANGTRLLFAHDAKDAGLSPWATPVAGSRLVSVPAWVVTLHDALTEVKGAPIGFHHWLLARAAEIPPMKRTVFADACFALVRLEPRSSRAMTEMLEMHLDDGPGGNGPASAQD